jgi:hypothetical protein
MVDTAKSAYFVLDRAITALRANLNTEIAAIVGEATVGSHTLPDVQSSDITVRDDRKPPQAAQWVSLALADVTETLGLNIGRSLTTYRITARSGLRTMVSVSSAGSYPSDPENDSWLRSYLLSRAVQTVIQRDLFAVTGITNVTFAGQATLAQDDPGSVYQIETRYDVVVATHNAAFT